MSASDAGFAIGAIAFQLAATLDAYEQDIACLVQGPFDAEVYLCVRGHMDQMRLYTASLPTLSVAWVEVLIRHFELTHGMWRLQKDPQSDTDLARLHAKLGEATLRLSRGCTLLMPFA